MKGALANQEYQGRRYVGFKGEFVRDDLAEGVWKGKQIRFKNQFAGHLFTPSEIQQLLNDETITFTTEKGSYTGKLEVQTYQGHQYVGFKAQFPKKEGYVYGQFKGQEISFKGEFMGYKFTDDDIKKLLAGTKIAFKGKSKAGKEMMVAGGLAQQTYQGRKFWGKLTVCANVETHPIYSMFYI